MRKTHSEWPCINHSLLRDPRDTRTPPQMFKTTCDSMTSQGSNKIGSNVRSIENLRAVLCKHAISIYFIRNWPQL